MAGDTWGHQTVRQQLQCAVFEGTFGSEVRGDVLSVLAAPIRQTLAQLADRELGFFFGNSPRPRSMSPHLPVCHLRACVQRLGGGGACGVLLARPSGGCSGRGNTSVLCLRTGSDSVNRWGYPLL